MAVLIAAHEWGTPPWEIAGGSKYAWYQRWLEYRTQQGKAAKVQAQRLANGKRS